MNQVMISNRYPPFTFVSSNTQAKQTWGSIPGTKKTRNYPIIDTQAITVLIFTIIDSFIQTQDNQDNSKIMSMKKRRNELGHLSKEDYDAIQGQGSDVEDEPASSRNREAQRASEEVLSKRRILKVSS
jgi:hypothetical protein